MYCCFLNLLVHCTAANSIGHYVVGVVAMDDTVRFNITLQNFISNIFVTYPNNNCCNVTKITITRTIKLKSTLANILY